MFVTRNQFYVFTACVALGAACGIFFGISAAVKSRVRFYPVRVAADFAAFLCAGSVRKTDFKRTDGQIFAAKAKFFGKRPSFACKNP